MRKIFVLLDYKQRFVSKYLSIPYRSGMDKDILKETLIKNQIEPVFLNYTDIDLRRGDYKGKLFLYTSSEDHGLSYKSYIEDVLLGIKALGGVLIPEFDYFRAHHNKVYMEMIRDLSTNQELKNIQTKYYGTIEDIKRDIDNLQFPLVVKPASGAVSTGVSLAKDANELLKSARKIMRTKTLRNELWDYGRYLKWKGYIRESKYRNKIIVQTFVPNLSEDWKVLVYGKKYYVLNRKTRPNDFRASGSGLISYQENLPEGFLDFAERTYNSFNVPNMGMDIAFDGKEFYLIEFQMINFGTHTLDTSPFYFIKINNKWTVINDKSLLEEEYVTSVVEYLNKLQLYIS